MPATRRIDLGRDQAGTLSSFLTPQRKGHVEQARHALSSASAAKRAEGVPRRPSCWTA